MEKVSSPVDAYVGLGSNLGDREAMIRAAIGALRQAPGVEVVRVSSLVETKPVGPVAQPDFINAVAHIRTTLEPLALLDRLLAVEQRLGRVRKERWGPRTIDLDVLAYGDQSFQHPRLTVPHPEIKNRPFVQAGLREVGYSLS